MTALAWRRFTPRTLDWLFGTFFLYLALLAVHAVWLDLPYYWDEAGYFVPAAIDLFRHGWLIPHTTAPNGHPPLLSIYLAGAWSIFGFHPAVTRAAMLVAAALLLAGVFRLGERTFGRRTALVACFLLGLTPLFVAQSMMAQLDLPAAMFLVWTLVWRERDRPLYAVACATSACWTKETTILLPLVLLAFDLRLERDRGWPRRMSQAIPIGALVLWYVYYHHFTGYWLGNPQYFAYNVAETALSIPRVLLSLLRHLWQLSGYNGLWLLTALALYNWRTTVLLWKKEWIALIAAYVAFHSLAGGAVLSRYLLPALALYVLTVAPAFTRKWMIGTAAAVLVVNWYWNPPYPFPFEDNLAFTDFVHLHQAAAEQLKSMQLSAPVLTAWPASDEITNPDLGYVKRPIPVLPLENFGANALVAARSGAPLYIYSRFYQPEHDLSARSPLWQRWAERYFDYQQQLPVADWVQRLSLQTYWSRVRRGQWVMLAVPARVGDLRRSTAIRSEGRLPDPASLPSVPETFRRTAQPKPTPPIPVR